jgi:hypothetical protein
MMKKNHHIWRVWVKTLHRWGVDNLVASFLEAAGPLTIIGAQAIYVGQPVLGSFLPDEHLKVLAVVLEQDDEREAFVSFVREGVRA